MNTVRKESTKQTDIIKLVEPKEQEIKLHPFQCACTLVKAGRVAECPAHHLANFLSEARH